MLWKSNTFSKCYNCECDDFKKVENLIQNPGIEAMTKDEIPLWGFYTLNVTQLPEFTQGGIEYYSPCAENCKDVFALCIDYDYDLGAAKNGNKYVTYDEAKALVAGKGWQAYMHTSYSHQKPEKGNFDRFRVILPLDKPLDAREYMQTYGAAFRAAILPMFDGCDPSTLSIARFFKIPSCPLARKTLYRWDILNGRRFSMKDWEFDYYSAKSKLGLISAKQKAKSEKLSRSKYKNTERAKNWLTKTLQDLGAWDSGNNIHSQLLFLNGWATRIGISLIDREDIFLGWTDSKHEKEVGQIVKGI